MTLDNTGDAVGKAEGQTKQEVNMLLVFGFFLEVIHDVNVQRTGGNYDFRGVNSLLMGNYQLPFRVSWPVTRWSFPSSFLSVSGHAKVCYYSAQVFADANGPHLISGPLPCSTEARNWWVECLLSSIFRSSEVPEPAWP